MHLAASLQQLREELKKTLRQDIPIIEGDAHINDDKFANAAFEQLLEVMGVAK